MNKLNPQRRAQVLGCLVEGNSILATVRMTGVAKEAGISDYVWSLEEIVALVDTHGSN